MLKYDIKRMRSRREAPALGFCSCSTSEYPSIKLWHEHSAVPLLGLTQYLDGSQQSSVAIIYLIVLFKQH